MRTTIDIPDPIYKQAKIRAIESGLTLRELILHALERAFESPVSAPAPPAASRWASRKLRPEFQRLTEQDALKLSPGGRSIDDILADIKEDRRL